MTWHSPNRGNQTARDFRAQFEHCCGNVATFELPLTFIHQYSAAELRAEFFLEAQQIDNLDTGGRDVSHALQNVTYLVHSFCMDHVRGYDAGRKCENSSV